jgi:hypothetical protein
MSSIYTVTFPADRSNPASQPAKLRFLETEDNALSVFLEDLAPQLGLDYEDLKQSAIDSDAPPTLPAFMVERLLTTVKDLPQASLFRSFNAEGLFVYAASAIHGLDDIRAAFNLYRRGALMALGLRGLVHLAAGAVLLNWNLPGQPDKGNGLPCLTVEEQSLLEGLLMSEEDEQALMAVNAKAIAFCTERLARFPEAGTGSATPALLSISATVASTQRSADHV